MEMNSKRVLSSTKDDPVALPKSKKKKQSGYVVFENQYLTITNQGSTTADALALSRLSARAESDDVSTVCYEVSAETDLVVGASSKEGALKQPENVESVSSLTPELYEYFANNKDPPPGPPDISQNVYHGPCQPTNVVFPLRSFGKDSRAFKQEWYLRHTWLEYSFEADAAFCFACRFFAMPGQNAKGSAFTTAGFRNWKRAMEGKSGLRQHGRSEFHQRCFERWMAFNQFNPQVQMVIAQSTAAPIANTEVSTWKRSSVTPLMWNKQSEPKKKVEDYCRFLKTLIESIRFGTQTETIQFKEDFFKHQMNYFKNLVSLVAKVDETVNRIVKTGINETVLVELIGVMADSVKSDIGQSIKRKTNFSLVFLECRDKNDHPVVAFVARYFQDDSVVEAFLGFHQLQSATEEDILRFLNDSLHEGGIDMKNCIGQTYDLAPSLSNYLPKLTEMISQIAPQALCYHSNYRNMDNLLMDAVRKVHSFTHFLPLLKSIVAFFESCPVAKNLLEQAQLRHYPDDEPKSLIKYPDQEPGSYLTHSCVALKSSFNAIVEVLVEVARNYSAESSSLKARSVLGLMNLDFLFSVALASKIYEELYFLIDYLQDDDKDMSSVFDLLNVANSTLVGIKTEEVFQSLMTEATSLALIKNKACEAGKLRSEISPVRLKTESDSSVSSRESIFNLYIDCVLSELNQRYNEETQSLIHASDSFNPKSANFLQYNMMEGIAEWYNANESDLENELKQLQRFLDRQKEKGDSPSTLDEMVKHLVPFQEAFYESFKLLQTVVTLAPETGPSNQHESLCFRIKEFFKRIAAEEEMSNSAFLTLENERLGNISSDVLINRFKLKHANRIYKFS